MKSVIIYASTHHENTKKVVEAIEKECGEELKAAVEFYKGIVNGNGWNKPFT